MPKVTSNRYKYKTTPKIKEIPEGEHEGDLTIMDEKALSYEINAILNSYGISRMQTIERLINIVKKQEVLLLEKILTFPPEGHERLIIEYKTQLKKHILNA